MSFEVLGLLKDFLEDFVFGIRRVAVVGSSIETVFTCFAIMSFLLETQS